MRKVVIALALCMPLAADAAVNCRIPPVRYDHEPSRHYRVIEDPNLRGNAFTSLDRSTIVIPRYASAAWKACYVRHEKGHVNGWGARHAGLRHAAL